MMFSVPTEPYEINPIKVRALELFLILHMDHEQNASTSTVRNAGPSVIAEAIAMSRPCDGCSSASGCIVPVAVLSGDWSCRCRCRLQPGEPVCMHCIRHCYPLGPCTRVGLMLLNIWLPKYYKLLPRCNVLAPQLTQYDAMRSGANEAVIKMLEVRLAVLFHTLSGAL